MPRLRSFEYRFEMEFPIHIIERPDGNYDAYVPLIKWDEPIAEGETYYIAHFNAEAAIQQYRKAQEELFAGRCF